MTDYPTLSVLNDGYVRLVEHMGTDLSIVRAARVSYDAAWRAGQDEHSDERLIHYLWNNKHTTPFEVVTFSFEVLAPIFVVRQWHRHRTWTYNELSGRYRELNELYYIPKPEHIGQQSKGNKQARVLGLTDEQQLNRHNSFLRDLDSQCHAAFSLYRELLAEGWPRELARMVLPLNTYTHMFATVDLNNLLKFITLRDHEHAQWEIRQYAGALLKLIEPIVPVTVAAFRGNRPE